MNGSMLLNIQCLYCSTLFQYALKKISRRNLGKDYMKEAQVLCKLNHSNVLAYKACFNEGDNFCIVMEYCPHGDLRNEIEGRKQKGQKFTESEIVNWTIQLCHALQVRIQAYSFRANTFLPARALKTREWKR